MSPLANINKQLLNEIEQDMRNYLGRVRLRQITQTEALINPHIHREPNSIIVLLFFENILNSV